MNTYILQVLLDCVLAGLPEEVFLNWLKQYLNQDDVLEVALLAYSEAMK